MTPRRPRSAFTLVELLVVASIMAVFLGLVITGARPGAKNQIRQAAQLLVSALTAAQSRGLGNPAGAAVIIQSGTASGLSATMSVRGLNGDLPPFINGTSSFLTVASATSATVTLTPLNADGADLESVFKIRFGGSTGTAAPYQPQSAWLGFTSAGAGGTGTVVFRGSAAQSAENTIWPEATGTNTLSFEAARYPIAADTAVDFPKAAAIDLRFCGIGEEPGTTWGGGSYSGSWGGLAEKGAIGILFDSVGGVESMFQSGAGGGAPTVQPVGPVYLLVTSRTEIDDSSFPPLSSPTALWVVIHPQTGRVTVASNVAQTGTSATDIRAARARARAGAAIGK